MLRSLYRRVILGIGHVLTMIYCRRYEVVGRQHVPKTGGLIVASNHLNNADPPMIARAVGRPVVFMAKKEMLAIPVVGTLFRWWGTFPVRRGEADIAALRVAQEVVRGGDALMMFPEGTRSRTGGLGKGHPGTALIALRTGAPVLPVAITGTEGIRWPSFFVKPRSVRHIRVVIGEPFRLERTGRVDTEAVTRATEQIMRRVAELLPPEYRGVYADAGDDSLPSRGPTAMHASE